MRLTIAAAQSVSERGNVSKNIESHCRLVECAFQNGVQLLIFPELSITGYEPDLAEELAFTSDDKRLTPLKELSKSKNMIIIAGAPVKLDTGLHIGSFILFPDYSSLIYTKHFLHPGEEKYFVPGKLNPVLNFNNETFSIAICADILHPLHSENAFKAGSTFYLAGVFITPEGYRTDTELLKEYAGKYSMTVLMSNYGSESGNYQSAGRSMVISDKGNVIAEFDGLGEGLVIIEKENNDWTGSIISIN